MTESTHKWISLERWTALSTLALMLATFRLWIPSPTPGFPLIPAFEMFCSTPLWVDWGLATGFAIALGAAILIRSERAGLIWMLVVAIGAALICLNQHRLQPWLYQCLLFALIFKLKPGFDRGQWLRYLVISTYFFSAVGKIDFEFLHTVGQEFLGRTLAMAGVDIGTWPSGVRLAWVAAMPATELLLAIALLVATLRARHETVWLRRSACVAVCLFHLLLLLMFAFVLQHSLGVILWNLQFAVQAILLFWWIEESQTNAVAQPNVAPPKIARPRVGAALQRYVVAGIIGIAICMPLFERWGYWDHWTSWALYAPHSSRVDIAVAQTAVEQLPSDLRAMVDVEENSLWLSIPIAQWSLTALRAPVVPQARFQLGIARSLAQNMESTFTIKADLRGTANRLDGRRANTEAIGASQIEGQAKLFLLNTRPRQLLD